MISPFKMADKKLVFYSSCDFIEYLLYKGTYEKALELCSRLEEHFPQQYEFSLRAKLYKAKCHFKLDMESAYTQAIQEAKASHPGCSRHINEFHRQLEQNTDCSGTPKQGKLFRTFRCWEEMEEKLKENKLKAFQFCDILLLAGKEEIGAGDTINEPNAANST